MAWYSEIQQRFDGNINYSKWDEPDGTHMENVTIQIPSHDIQAVRIDFDDKNILVDVDGWQTIVPAKYLPETIIERLDLYG